MKTLTLSETVRAAHTEAVAAHEAAFARLREAERGVFEARGAHKSLPRAPTHAQVKASLEAVSLAEEILALATRDREAAEGAVVAREAAIAAAERQERHELQDDAVARILSVQPQVDALEKQIAKLRATQQEHFVTVWNCNEPYAPRYMGEAPGPRTYVNLDHVIQRSREVPVREKAPLPPSTLQPKNGGPLDNDEKWHLLYLLDNYAFIGPARTRLGLEDQDLRATCGDFSMYGTPITRDPEVFAAIREGLTGRIGPDRAWIVARARSLGLSTKITAPIGHDGKPALDHAGNIRPEA